MAQPPFAKPIQSRPRAVHLVLRDGDTVDGGIFLTDGQALAPYLGSRKDGWVNVVNAAWGREGEVHKHAVLQTQHIVLASSSRAEYPVVASSQVGVPRAVDVVLEDGTRLHGSLLLGTKQRLSDYLAGTGTFFALLGTKRVQDGIVIGDVAVNGGCVKAVREATVIASAAAEPAAEQSWGGMRRGTTSVAMVTPRVSERAVPAPGNVARHWLAQLARDAQLDPPEASEITPTTTLAEIWANIAKRNDMADPEIAVLIATSYKLELADFEEVTVDAIKCVPAKIARRLGVLPVKIDGRTLVVAVADPESIEIEQQLGFATKHHLRKVVATPADLAGAIDWYYADGTPRAG